MSGKRATSTMSEVSFTGEDTTCLEKILGKLRAVFLADCGDLMIDTAKLELVNRHGFFAGVIAYDAGETGLTFQPAHQVVIS